MRGLIGVFSTRERAEAIYAGSRREPDVEELELDAMVGFRYIVAYEVHVDLDGGRPRGGDVPRPPDFRHPSRCVVVRGTPWPGKDVVTVRSPISSMHAAEVAMLERQRWLRERVAAPTGAG
jgi:hypothetical protein